MVNHSGPRTKVRSMYVVNMSKYMDDRNTHKAEDQGYGFSTGQGVVISQDVDETGDFGVEVEEANAD